MGGDLVVKNNKAIKHHGTINLLLNKCMTYFGFYFLDFESCRSLPKKTHKSDFWGSIQLM